MPIHPDAVRQKLRAQHVGQALVQCSERVTGVCIQAFAPLLHQLALVPDRKTHVGPG